MQQQQTTFNKLLPTNPAYEQASNYLAQGIGTNHIALGQAEHEIFYTAEHEGELIGVSRLLIHPTPKKIVSYDFNTQTIQNYRTGLLAGAYIDPLFRAKHFQLNGHSLARHLSNNRIADAWSGDYHPQASPLDVLITRCRQTSSPMYENNEQFRQAGGWIDKQRGPLTYHVSTKPTSNINLDEFINQHYTGPRQELKKAI